MKNKFLVLNAQLSVLLCMMLLGCSSADPLLPDAEPQPDRGEPVTLTFDMYSATVTRAEGASSTAEDMAIGKMFRIYAFEAGSTDYAKPLDNSIYTVQADEKETSKPGKATGNLTLYRGTYDLYLVSYNSTDVPAMNNSGAFVVNNGKDFMYTKLEGIVVQPDKTGDNKMEVSLPRPFTRMGAQVVTTVKAKNGMQPVKPEGLVVNYIKVTGLRKELTYILNNTAWEAVAADAPADDSYTFQTFSNNTMAYDVYAEGRESAPGVLLPVDATQKMKFEVNLTVSYKVGSDTKTSTNSYYATVEKALLPGMTYQFDFSLTFYGSIVPADLTLGIREWTTYKITAEDLGKN